MLVDYHYSPDNYDVEHRNQLSCHHNHPDHHYRSRHHSHNNTDLIHQFVFRLYSINLLTILQVFSFSVTGHWFIISPSPTANTLRQVVVFCQPIP